MSRRENIRKRTHKVAKAQGKPINEVTLTDYATGMGQQYRGELMAKVIEQFLASRPEHVRKSFENMVKDLQSFGRDNPARFRAKLMTSFMVAFQNGTVEGARSGDSLDIKPLFDQVAEGLNKKYLPED
jgi:hypothetical protein